MDRTYKKTAQWIADQLQRQPKIGLILGSGLGVIADEIQSEQQLPYSKLEGFPESTVEGHDGKLVIGELEGKAVLAMKGRFHYYEGYAMQQVTYPIRVMQELGVETLIVTNAAGGINTSFQPGDLMCITDHINFMFANPLIGPNDAELGPRFPDMSQAYDQTLQQTAFNVAEQLGVKLKKGVYVSVSGPSYETPAEIRMFRHLGGDAVGMSTVPEVIAAVHSGLKVLGISCITNMAAGILDQPLSHDEVMETAEQAKASFIRLVKGVVRLL
jgi:purine-nucleoside phosphorylase